MLDKTRIDKNGFHFMIEDVNRIKIEQCFTDTLYDLSGKRLSIGYGHTGWIIGLSQNQYDNYYIIFDNNSSKIIFKTCVYKIEKDVMNDTKPEFSGREIMLIQEYIDLYFDTHKNEKLLYLNI